MNVHTFLKNRTPRSIDLFLLWKSAYRALRIKRKRNRDIKYETLLKIAEGTAIKLGISKILGQRVAYALAMSLSDYENW